MRTKLGDSRFSRYVNMIAGVKTENVSSHLNHAPFRGALSPES